MASSVEQRYAEYQQRLKAEGQAHLLAFWPELDEARREQLLADLDEVDFDRCRPLIADHVTRKPQIALPTSIEPPAVLPAEGDPAEAERYERAMAAGAAAVRDGKVAAFTVAGGQGTRLGYDGPKGAFRIGPVRSAPLFQLFAEALLGAQRRYGHRPRWYIMTGPANHGQTVVFFEDAGFFGLAPDDVMFFQQRQMPAFLPDGRIALSERHRLALSPDGHGGSLRALAESGALADMRARGIEYISYFQVDNPLVRPIDALFVGLHIDTGSEMSSKVVSKADDLERVGNFCVADGKCSVIEYSDLPDELAHARNEDGSRRFDAGSVAIHMLSREFVERLTSAGSGLSLPWHRADKKVAVVGEDGQTITPEGPNVVKLEMFVFDAIPLARNPMVRYTPREEEFSPVKNAEGVDSAVTARRDLIRRAARWLEACGCDVPRGSDGEPAMPLEISPARALDAADLREQLREKPRLVAGEPWVLA